MKEKKKKIEQIIKFYTIQINIIKNSIKRHKVLLKKLKKEELKPHKN
jgi:hypothetical protein